MKSSHSQEDMPVKQNKGYQCYEGRVSKSKEASFVPSSVKKVLAFLTQNYS